jgi:hypothetical protein
LKSSLKAFIYIIIIFQFGENIILVLKTLVRYKIAPQYNEFIYLIYYFCLNPWKKLATLQAKIKNKKIKK